MIRFLFGKKPSPPTQLHRVLIPQGAAASPAQWSMAEALVAFVMAATERALFRWDELPAHAVAVFRSYQLAGDLDGKGIDYLFCNENYAAKAGEVVQGLRLIEMNALADVIQSASDAWIACSDQSAVVQQATMQRFAEYHAQQDGIAQRCSDWIRSSDLTLVLGDGRLDTVYKEVMKQLYRCNPYYAERRTAADQHRTRLGLRPVGPPALGPCSLEQLIADTEQKWGAA